MTHTKYIAAGFLSDAEDLIGRFIKENTLHFGQFAKLFRDSHFHLIYMGRETEEMSQYTQEIYQLTLKYLERSVFGSQIGAVYLLYALFRNQIVHPPIKIRLTLFHWDIIKTLYTMSVDNHYQYLHYVITYLLTNAFDFVAFSTLNGPLCGKGKAEMEQSTFEDACLLKDAKGAMSEFLDSNLLQSTKDLISDYEDMKRKIFKKSDDASSIDDFSSFIEQLDTLVQVGGLSSRATRSRNKTMQEVAGIGARRAEIKAASFSKKASYWQKSCTASEDEEPEKQIVPSGPRKRLKKRRVPQHERRVGRPRKATAAELEQLLLEDGAAESEGPSERKRKERREAAGYMTYDEDNYESLLSEIPKQLQPEFEEYSSSPEEEIELKTEEEEEEQSSEQQNGEF